jgi:hypothetical protein
MEDEGEINVFKPEDGSDRFFRKAGTYLTNKMLLHPRRL